MSTGSHEQRGRGRPPRRANKEAGSAVLSSRMERGDISGEHIAGAFKVQFGKGPAAATVRRWASGENAPSEQDAAKLDQILGCEGSLLRAFYPTVDREPISSDAQDPLLVVAADDGHRGAAESARPDAPVSADPSDRPTYPAPAGVFSSESQRYELGKPGASQGQPQDHDVAGIRHPGRPWHVRAGFMVLVVIVVAVLVVLLVTHPWSNGQVASPSSSSASHTGAGVQNTGSALKTPSNPALANPTGTVTVAALSCEAPAVPPAGTQTVRETEGTIGASTFSDPTRGCGAGPKVQAGTAVEVVCRIYAPIFGSVVPDGYWYFLANGTGRGRFAPANTFLNGDAPGAGSITNTDLKVPLCELPS